MTASLETLSRAEIRVIEDLFVQEITGRPAPIPRRVGLALTEKGLVEEALFVTGYKPTGAVTREAFRLTTLGHFRYTQWCERKT